MRSSKKGFELDPITLGTIALGIVLVVVFIVIGNNRMPQPVSPSYTSASTGATGGAPAYGGSPYGAPTGPYGAPTGPYGAYGAPPGMPPGMPPGAGPMPGMAGPSTGPMPGPSVSTPSGTPSGGGGAGGLGGLAGRRGGGMGLEED